MPGAPACPSESATRHHLPYLERSGRAEADRPGEGAGVEEAPATEGSQGKRPFPREGVGEGLRAAGVLPKWWNTGDPTPCRAEARESVSWGRRRCGGVGEVPEQTPLGEAAGGWRGAQEAGRSTGRGGPDRFLEESGPLPSPHQRRRGGPGAAEPADPKGPRHPDWSQTLRPSRRQSLSARQRRKRWGPGGVEVEPGGLWDPNTSSPSLLNQPLTALESNTC